MLAAFLAVPAVAFGAVLTEGDGSLSVTGANGTIVIQGHGVIYGQFDSGTLMVLDYKPDDGVSVPSISIAKRRPGRPGPTPALTSASCSPRGATRSS